MTFPLANMMIGSIWFIWWIFYECWAAETDPADAALLSRLVLDDPDDRFHEVAQRAQRFITRKRWRCAAFLPALIAATLGLWWICEPIV